MTFKVINEVLQIYLLRVPPDLFLVPVVDLLGDEDANQHQQDFADGVEEVFTNIIPCPARWRMVNEFFSDFAE